SALSFFFFVNATAPTAIYTLSLHDALPISRELVGVPVSGSGGKVNHVQKCFDPRSDFRTAEDACRAHWLGDDVPHLHPGIEGGVDRKSTRLNSSHVKISYAVFCLKKKKEQS